MGTPIKGRSLLYWLQKKRRGKRRRRRDPGAIPQTLQHVLKALEPAVFEAERERCPVTRALWEEIVGVRISDRSAPRRLEPDGILLVAVSSSVWAQELSMLSSTLCDRLVQRGQTVRGLRFAVGVVEPPRRGVQRFELRRVPAPAQIPDELQEEIRTIEDEELRDLIATAAASSLALSERKGEK